MMNLRTLVDPDATPAYPIVRSVGQADLKDALAKSVNDFLPMLDLWAEPLFLVSLSIILTIISVCLISGGLPLLFPLMSGFALVGPFAAIGCTKRAGVGSSALTLPGRTFLICGAPPRSPRSSGSASCS
jgi:uncharacterized membrane protein